MENTQNILKSFEAGVRLNSEIMFPLIEAWEQSGENQKLFCSERGIKIGTFGYWRKKYLESQGGFIELKGERNPSRVALIRTGSVELELDLPTSELANLVKQLR